MEGSAALTVHCEGGHVSSRYLGLSLSKGWWMTDLLCKPAFASHLGQAGGGSSADQLLSPGFCSLAFHSFSLSLRSPHLSS